MEWDEITRRFEIGQIVQTTLTKIDHFGIYSLIEPKVKGYTKRAEALLTLKVIDLDKYFKDGQQVAAKIMGFSEKHQTVELSIRQALPNPWPQYLTKLKIGDFVEGEVVLITESKAIIEIEPGVAGVLHKHELWMPCDKIDDVLMIKDRMKVQIINIDHESRMLILSVHGLFAGEGDSHEGQATFRIDDKLTDALRTCRWEMTRQKRRKYSFSAQFRSKIKLVHIIDTEQTLSPPLAAVLDGIGIKTRHSTLVEFEQLLSLGNSLLLVFVGAVAQVDLFLLTTIKSNPQMPVLICGTPEILQEIKSKLIQIPASLHFLKIPHELEELVTALNDSVTETEQIDRSEPDVDPAALPITSPTPNPDDSIGTLLKQIKVLTSASSVFIFQLNLNTMDTDIFASIGKDLTLSTFDKGHLQFSPISDAIIDGEYVFQERGCYHFKYMKPLGHFESLIGIRIRFADDCGYGLFLFGESPFQFSHLKEIQVEFCEMAVRALIQQVKYARKACEEQKFLLAGKLSSHFMHEMKNQMQAMDYWLEVLKTDSIRLNNDTIKNEDKAFKARFESALNGAMDAEKQAMSIENLFLNLFRKSEKRTVRLEKYLHDFVETLKPLAGMQKIKIVTDCAPNVQLAVNLASLSQILLNLFLNSLDFIPLVRKRTGLIEIRAYQVPDALPIKIEISDNGPGINERNKEKVFEMLFSTKKNGSGLGLAISKMLATEMAGRLSVKESLRLCGTSLLLELPK